MMFILDRESGSNIIKLSEGDPGVNRRLELLCYDDEIDFEEVCLLNYFFFSHLLLFFSFFLSSVVSYILFSFSLFQFSDNLSLKFVSPLTPTICHRTLQNGLKMENDLLLNVTDTSLVITELLYPPSPELTKVKLYHFCT